MSGQTPDPILAGKFLDAVRAWDLQEELKRLLAVSEQPAEPTYRKLNCNHVFHCSTCRKCWMGTSLEKTREGKYVCKQCNFEVEDVTDTPLGQSFIQLVQP